MRISYVAPRWITYCKERLRNVAVKVHIASTTLPHWTVTVIQNHTHTSYTPPPPTRCIMKTCAMFCWCGDSLLRHHHHTIRPFQNITANFARTSLSHTHTNCQRGSAKYSSSGKHTFCVHRSCLLLLLLLCYRALLGSDPNTTTYFSFWFALRTCIRLDCWTASSRGAEHTPSHAAII